MRFVAYLGFALFCVSCHICDYREKERPARIYVDLGSPCPSKSEAAAQMQDSDSLGIVAFEGSKPVPAVGSCEYQAQIVWPAIDEVRVVSYVRYDNEPCLAADQISGGHFFDIPNGATITEPVFVSDQNGSCTYQVHLIRTERAFSEIRSTKIVIDGRSPELGDCPDPVTLVGSESLLAHNEDEIIESVGPATLVGVVPPKTECAYRERYKETADVCG